MYDSNYAGIILTCLERGKKGEEGGRGKDREGEGEGERKNILI